MRLPVAGWRQVAIAIGNEHLQRASNIWKDQDEVIKKESDREGVLSLKKQSVV
jgi:hypothetical protein